MGQYHKVVNLDKREFLDPHQLGCGLKAWEQLANHPGTATALLILLATGQGKGGGDLDVDVGWHGSTRWEQENVNDPPPVTHDVSYIGRWAGDRITMVGDYGEQGDIQADRRINTGKIYDLCIPAVHLEKYPEEYEHVDKSDLYTDITPQVAKIIEHELNGTYEGEGWKRFRYDDYIECECGSMSRGYADFCYNCGRQFKGECRCCGQEV
jgi:hypothetical protein